MLIISELDGVKLEIESQSICNYLKIRGLYLLKVKLFFIV